MDMEVAQNCGAKGPPNCDPVLGVRDKTDG